MSAYLIVEHIITNAAKFEEYRVKVGPMIAEHGGRYLTKGGSHKCLKAATGNRNALLSQSFPIWDR